MDCLQFAAYGKICGKLDSTWMWAEGGAGQKCGHGRGLGRPNNHIEEKGGSRECHYLFANATDKLYLPSLAL